MEFRILGQVEIASHGVQGRVWTPVAAPNLRVLLSALLVSANELVASADLIEAIWPQAKPRHPRNALQICATRLRQLLTDAGCKARIVGSASGYTITATAIDIDLGLFGVLVRAADTAAERGDLHGEAEALRDALALWRGEPLSDVDSEALQRDAVPRLTERRLQVLQRRMDLELQLGNHAEIIAELRELSERHPLQERLWLQLMTALNGSGRRAEALDAYRAVSRHLASELGVDPGSHLRELHLSILKGEQPQPVVVQTQTDTWLGQCRLPAAVADFAGREAEVSALESLLRPLGTVPPARVVTISGLPGSGKTALALQIAHALRDDYPDGQWYIRLGGATPSPKTPAHVLNDLLRTAGVEPGAIPADPAEREGTLRARLADRRILLVLDDALDVAQVLPLLPGTPGCAVIITSRATLSGLAVLASARSFALDVLDLSSAQALVQAILGPQRFLAEPEAVAEMIALCGGLPLALRIAMVNLTLHPHTTVASYVASLYGHDRLTKLSVNGEPQVAVRAAFDHSYASLDESARRAFRLLGLHPATDVGTGPAAALYGTSEAESRLSLRALAAASLATPVEADRYQLHDLIRLYAVERLAADEPEASRKLARDRLFDWYLHSALAAGKALGYGIGGPGQSESLQGVSPASFATGREALDWFDRERDNVVALIRMAASHGLAALAGHLFEAMQQDLRGRNHLDAWEAGVEAALAGYPDEPAMKARLRLSQGTLRLVQGRYEQALHEMSLALPDAVLAGDETELRVLNNLGTVHLELGHLAGAAERLSQAKAVALRLGGSNLDAHLARILTNLGVVWLETGELEQAREVFTQAGASARAAGLRLNLKTSLDNLGEAQRELGNFDAAGEHFTEAATIARQLQARHLEAASLNGVAHSHTDAGRHDLARQIALASLQTSREMNQPRFEADGLNLLGLIAIRTGDAASSLDYYTQARDLAQGLGYRRAEILALAGMTSAGASREYAEQALTYARDGGHRLVERAILEMLRRVPGYSRQVDDNFPKLAAPARRALANGGFTRLADLAKVTEAEVARLHGMGPNALRVLRDALAAAGLSFSD